jgi:hypothetical protein
MNSKAMTKAITFRFEPFDFAAMSSVDDYSAIFYGFCLWYGYCRPARILHVCCLTPDSSRVLKTSTFVEQKPDVDR